MVKTTNVTTRELDDESHSEAIDVLLRVSLDEPVALVVQQTMRDVLDEVNKGARRMAEAQRMCEHVVQRFEAIATESLKVSPPPPMAATNRFKTLLLQYVVFLKKFANEKTIFRLVHNRIVVRQNLKFHNHIDNLLKGLQLPEGNEVLEDWQPRWEGYRDAQAAVFQAMSRQRDKLIENLDRTDTHAQTEALGLLLYEYNKVTAEYTAAELKVLYNAFTEVSRFSKNKTPTISTWFLPPYQFEFNETVFAFGGFGNVHFGKHCGTDVAVKRVILKPDADRAAVTAAFVKEANLWFRANNIPNVVRLFGANHLAKTPYFVSEYAANGTLKSYVIEEKNRHQVWKLLLDAANGIRALHQLRILHNDLKCDNIVVDFSGNAKIIDFGLCCELSRPNSKAQVPVMRNIGSVPWKAPELLLGEDTSPPSIASDVYAFGMCVIEAVSKSNPWDGWKEVMIKRKVKSGELPPRPPHVFEDDQWDLVKQMCALDPADRMPMDRVVEELTKFENQEGNRNIQRQQIIRTSMSELGSAVDLCPTFDGATNTEFPKSVSVEANSTVTPTKTDNGAQVQRQSSLGLSLDPINEVDDAQPSPTIRKDPGDTASIDQPNCKREPKPEPTPRDPPSVISATILKFRYITPDGSRKRIAQYQVELKLANEKTRTVWKRFSAFRNCRQGVRDRDGAQAADSLPFPSRFAASSNLARSTAKRRQKELNNFLKNVFAADAIALGVLMSDGTSYFKAGTESDVLL